MKLYTKKGLNYVCILIFFILNFFTNLEYQIILLKPIAYYINVKRECAIETSKVFRRLNWVILSAKNIIDDKKASLERTKRTTSI